MGIMYIMRIILIYSERANYGDPKFPGMVEYCVLLL